MSGVGEPALAALRARALEGVIDEVAFTAERATFAKWLEAWLAEEEVFEAGMSETPWRSASGA